MIFYPTPACRFSAHLIRTADFLYLQWILHML